MPDCWNGFHLKLVIAAGFIFSISAAHSEVRILQSQVPAIANGMVLQDDVVLHIPANKTVRVLLTPSNATKTIAGPFDGTVSDYGPSKLPSLSSKPALQFDAGTVATGSQHSPQGSK
jgi:hypothetical protein